MIGGVPYHQIFMMPPTWHSGKNHEYKSTIAISEIYMLKERLVTVSFSTNGVTYKMREVSGKRSVMGILIS